MKTFPVLAMAAVLAACNTLTSDVICTAEARAGLTVSPVDSITSAPVTSSLQVVAKEGAYADTAKVLIGTSVGLAWERAGTYTVEVSAPGYMLWSKSNVVVTKGICHVDGVAITAKLRKP